MLQLIYKECSLNTRVISHEVNKMDATVYQVKVDQAVIRIGTSFPRKNTTIRNRKTVNLQDCW
jgi:hypothetical protein